MRMETLGVTNRDLSSLSTPEITSPVSIPTRCETSPVVICSSFFALFFFLCSYPERIELGYMAFDRRQIKKFYRQFITIFECMNIIFEIGNRELIRSCSQWKYLPSIGIEDRYQLCKKFSLRGLTHDITWSIADAGLSGVSSHVQSYLVLIYHIYFSILVLPSCSEAN